MSVHEKAPHEMRRQVRVDVPGVVHVTGTQDNRAFGQLVNISEEGMMILTAEPITENTIFQLTIGFSNAAGQPEPVEVGVESLWCHKGNNEDRYWAGFFIIDISEQDEEKIHRLIG